MAVRTRGFSHPADEGRAGTGEGAFHRHIDERLFLLAQTEGGGAIG